MKHTLCLLLAALPLCAGPATGPFADFMGVCQGDPKSYGYEKCSLHSEELSFHGRAFVLLLANCLFSEQGPRRRRVAIR